MPTPELLAHWFTFTPPVNEADKNRHVKIRDAETVCAEAVSNAITAGDFPAITTATFAFATVINEQAPESADKTAAIRCVRIARMAANEAVLYGRKIGEAFDYATAANQCGGLALQHLTLARYQASASIALGGK
jgi:hypothetical protein